TDSEATYRAARNELRKYNATSIVESALILLHQRFETPEKEVRALPWLILSLAKLALQDRMIYEIGPSITPGKLAALAQKIWASGGLSGDGPPQNLHRAVRSWAYVQMEFQRPDTFEFVRWPAILGGLPDGHPAKDSFEAVFGLTPNDFLDLAWAVYAAVLQGREPLTSNYFDALRPRYGNGIDVMLAALSKDMRGLRAHLQSEPIENRSRQNFLFEAPVFRQFPLLRGSHGLHFCWHRKVFSRGMDELVHHKLSGGGEAYTKTFSDIFEDYVVELAKNTKLPSLPENQFWGFYGGDKRAVEIILRAGDINVLVEAKFGLYQDAYMTFDNAAFSRAKLYKLRDGVAKGADVSRRLSSTGCDSFWGTRKRDFLLLVTNRQLYIPTGHQLELISSEGSSQIDDKVRLSTTQELSLENIFILSLDEYERLMVAVADGTVTLDRVMESLADQARDQKSHRMDARQLLSVVDPLQNISSRLTCSVEASMARIHQAFGVDYDPMVEPWRLMRQKAS
ncbi:MAG: hypothetical protein KGR99_15320, partial [Betaproteobacteria bacterium]|nr:hypothetical protein [Betaproteobacteria bacterium]